MDPLAFLSWQFVMFSLFVATIMYVLRTVVEYIVPKLTQMQIWNSLLLLLLPIFIGAAMGGWLKAYPYATGLTTTIDHIGYGAVAGLLSTVLFKVIKEMLIGRVSNAVSGVINVITPTPTNPNTTTTTTTTTVQPPSGSLMGGQTPPNPSDSNTQ